MKWLVVLVALTACANPERDVDSALGAYRRSIVEMNVDATVELFAPSASISHANEPPVIGKAAIGAFLRTFSGYKVTSYDLAAASTRISGNTAAQHGTYHQAVDTPDGQHLQVGGVFDASWRLEPDGHWRITRMHTESR
jgi:ketosteroid isomerase-like protein